MYKRAGDEIGRSYNSYQWSSLDLVEYSHPAVCVNDKHLQRTLHYLELIHTRPRCEWTKSLGQQKRDTRRSRRSTTMMHPWMMPNVSKLFPLS